MMDEREEELSLEDLGAPEDTTPPDKVEVEVHSWDERTKVHEFEDHVVDLAAEGGVVGILRYLPNGQKKTIGEVSAELWSLGWVQANLGGGKYQFGAKDGRGKYAGAVTLEIEGEPKQWPPPEEPKDKAGEDVERLEKLVEGFKGSSGSMEMFQMMLSMMTLMQSQTAPLLEALLNRQLPERTPASELKDLLGLVREVSPEGGGGDGGFSSVVGPLVPRIVSILDHAASGAPAVQPNQPAPPPPPAAPQPGPGSEWVGLVRPHMPQLQGWASSNRSAETLARFTVEALDPAALEVVLEQLGRGEDFLVEFFVYFPDARPFEAWYRTFWATLASLFKWDDVEEPEEEPHSEPPLSEPEEEKDPDEDLTQ